MLACVWGLDRSPSNTSRVCGSLCNSMRTCSSNVMEVKLLEKPKDGVWPKNDLKPSALILSVISLSLQQQNEDDTRSSHKLEMNPE